RSPECRRGHDGRAGQGGSAGSRPSRGVGRWNRCGHRIQHNRFSAPEDVVMTNKPFTYSPGMPVDIDDIAAHVAYERGLGAGGSDAYKTLLRVAELTAIVAKTNQIVRLTDEGLVDVVTGVSLDDVE